MRGYFNFIGTPVKSNHFVCVMVRLTLCNWDFKNNQMVCH